MNIDERLERLAERHEALTQTVELMAAENKDRDSRLTKHLSQIVVSIEKLVHVAESHEHRLSDLEEGQA
jgi:archaellum component FlaC